MKIASELISHIENEIYTYHLKKTQNQPNWKNPLESQFFSVLQLRQEYKSVSSMGLISEYILFS